MRQRSLEERFPPSEACGCPTCLSFCKRPGWWTVKQAADAFEAGLGHRMMLEMAPDRSFAVLSPAFKGNEQFFALTEHAGGGCTFLVQNQCEVHGTGLQPLECSFCHHERVGQGPKCHREIERSWNTAAGRALVVRWSKASEFWHKVERGS
jgi:hypothetical protein